MKDLNEIEEIYNESFEKITEEFQNQMKESKDHDKLHQIYKKKLDKILKKKNSSSKKYIKHNKEKLLELPEKHPKKYQKQKYLNAKSFNFNQNILEITVQMLKKMGFNFKIKIITFWNSKPIVFFRIFFFKKRLFFSSIKSDIDTYVSIKFKKQKAIVLKLKESSKKKYDKTKEKILEKIKVIKEKKKKISEKLKSKLKTKKQETDKDSESKPTEKNDSSNESEQEATTN